MEIISIPKNEYSRIVKTQEKLSEKLNLLQKMFEEEIQDEVKPEYAKKLDRISASLDKGKGVAFSSAKEAKKFLKSL